MLKRSASVCFKSCDKQSLIFWNCALGSLVCSGMQHSLYTSCRTEKGLIWCFTVAKPKCLSFPVCKILQTSSWNSFYKKLQRGLRRYLTVHRKQLGVDLTSFWRHNSNICAACRREVVSFLRRILFLLILHKWHDNICSINGTVCPSRKCRTLNCGPFFHLLLLWSLIATLIFNICHKFVLAGSHFMYLLLALLLIWEAFPKSSGFFWLHTVLWIGCSRRF